MVLVNSIEILNDPSSFREAQEQVGVLGSLVRVSIPPRRYGSQIALVSSICESSNCLEEEKHDTLMEDDARIDSRSLVDGIIVE
jgi:hypothetical protein